MDDETIEETVAPTKKQFEGFRKIEKTSKNFYRVPNEWTNIMAGINNLAELKVIEYIMRHTWGFGEYDQYKHITVDEFMHGRLQADGVTRMDEGTGLKSDRSVKDGLKAAIDHGYILCDVDDKDRARIKKSYKLKMRQVDTTPQNDDQENNGQVDTTPLEGSSYPSEVQNLPPDQVAATPRTQDETPERNLKKKTSGRKNGKSQRNSTVSTQEESSHSFGHSQDKSSFSPEGTKPAIVLTEKEQQIVKFGKKDIFKAADPVIDEKLKEDCGILAELIETQEQFDSLVAVVRSRFPKGAIHLKNLTNANVLNEWAQIQEQCTPGTQESPASDNEFTATDEELAEKIKSTARYYREEHRSEELLEQIMHLKRKMMLSNDKLYDAIINASFGVYPEHGIDMFMEKLQGSLYW
jgi:hypothetical protein